MLDCSLNGMNSDCLTVSNIPNRLQYQWLIDLAETCDCEWQYVSSTSMHIIAPPAGLLVIESEIIGFATKLQFLENCLAKS